LLYITTEYITTEYIMGSFWSKSQTKRKITKKKKPTKINVVNLQPEVDRWENTPKHVEPVKYTAIPQPQPPGPQPLQKSAEPDPPEKRDDNIHQMEEVDEPYGHILEKQPEYVNSDRLIENGEIEKLIDAITRNIPLHGRWQPINYAAKCGQFYLVNWLMASNMTDLKVC
jgi:hypothetical protein